MVGSRNARELDDHPVQATAERKLDAARAHEIQSILLQNRAQALERAINVACFGYPAEFMQQYAEGLNTATADDVAGTVKRYLSPKRLLVVAVGPAETIVPQLEAFGEVTLGGQAAAQALPFDQPQLAEDMLAAFVKPYESSSAGVVSEGISSLLTRPKQNDWLIDGFIENGSETLVQGQPYGGKSFLMIDMALSVATGTPWQGHDVAQGPVVILAGERASGLGRRFAAWGIHNDVALDDVPLAVISSAPNLCNDDEAKRLGVELHRIAQEKLPLI